MTHQTWPTPYRTRVVCEVCFTCPELMFGRSAAIQGQACVRCSRRNSHAYNLFLYDIRTLFLYDIRTCKLSDASFFGPFARALTCQHQSFCYLYHHCNQQYVRFLLSGWWNMSVIAFLPCRWRRLGSAWDPWNCTRTTERRYWKWQYYRNRLRKWCRRYIQIPDPFWYFNLFILKRSARIAQLLP